MNNIIYLNDEDLLKVYHKNTKLQLKVKESYQDSQIYMIKLTLDYIKDSLYDYSINFDGNSYIKIKDKRKFILGIKSAHAKHKILDDEGLKILNNIITLYSRLCYIDEHSIGYKKIKHRINIMTNKLKQIVLEEFNYMTEVSENHLIRLFTNVYVEDNLSDNRFYVDEDYVLYESYI
ncbi:hypothetical protein [Clostridioides sp. ZZV15-6597]|uniref:hypothetical protein n=1 Tax=Clostridioides sp. ZZV15-6597 TaxID=2811500 RepID=UPI001D12042D|nr:hypothetical protein [Clostridioides sp. ZZV15-6597]